MTALAKGKSGSKTSSAKDKKTMTYDRLIFPPKIMWTKKATKALQQAELLLAQLTEISQQFPNPNLLLKPLIPNAHSGVNDKLVLSNARQVSSSGNLNQLDNIIRFNDAIDLGLRLIAENEPLSIHFLQKIHSLVMDGQHAAHPGKIRDKVVMLKKADTGEIIYSAPKVECLPILLSRLEHFLNQPPKSFLAHVAICYAELESIHPFQDGNGRVGVLFIVLWLVEKKIISTALATVVSFYLYAYLHSVTHVHSTFVNKIETGKWLIFFFDIVAFMADMLIKKMQKVLAVVERFESHDFLTGQRDIGKKIIQNLLFTPFFTAYQMAQNLDAPIANVRRVLATLQSAGFISIVNKSGNANVYGCTAILAILDEPIILGWSIV